MFPTNGPRSACVTALNPGWQFRDLAPILSSLSPDQPTVGTEGAVPWS